MAGVNINRKIYAPNDDVDFYHQPFYAIFVGDYNGTTKVNRVDTYEDTNAIMSQSATPLSCTRT